MPLKTTSDEPPVLNMIPMVDIMFNLILFLLVGTQFAGMERDIALRVPEVTEKTLAPAAPSRRIVNVYSDGSIRLDATPVTLEELAEQLARAHREQPDPGVLIRGDCQSQFQRIAEVLAACKQAGVQELAVSVRNTPERK